MTLLITADWQLSSNQRDAYRFDNLIQFADLIEKHKVSHLLILGDLTEEKNYHPDWLVNDIVELLYNFSRMCKVIILEGNHDKAGAQAYFEFVCRLRNVMWVNQPYRINLEELNCLFLPHTDDLMDYMTSSLWNPMPYWVFAHETFAEAQTESGFHLRGTPLDILPVGARVISGDIHTPQELSDGQRTVTYVGAPYNVDFGDEINPRALLIDGAKEISIPLDGVQKRLFDVNAETNWKELFSEAPRPFRDLAKIRYQLSPGERENWPNMKAQLRDTFEANGYEVSLILPVAPPSTKLAAHRRPTHQKRNDEELIADFGKRQKVPAPTLEVGLEIAKAF